MNEYLESWGSSKPWSAELEAIADDSVADLLNNHFDLIDNSADGMVRREETLTPDDVFRAVRYNHSQFSPMINDDSVLTIGELAFVTGRNFQTINSIRPLCLRDSHYFESALRYSKEHSPGYSSLAWMLLSYEMARGAGSDFDPSFNQTTSLRMLWWLNEPTHYDVDFDTFITFAKMGITDVVSIRTALDADIDYDLMQSVVKGGK